MARPGVTYQEVANAAQQIAAAGKYPTIEAIRTALGTGSNSTLGTHLRNWKAQHRQDQGTDLSENIPSELISALKGVWDRVINLADEKIQAVEIATQQDLARKQQELTSLHADYATGKEQNQQLKQDLNLSCVENATLQHAITEYKIQIASYNAKQLASEQQLADKDLRINELHAQNNQIQANLEHYRAASQEQRQQDQLRHEQQQAYLEQTLQQTNQELAHMKSETNNLQQQCKQLDYAYNSVQQELSKINLELSNSAAQLQASCVELATKNTALQQLQVKNSTLQQRFDEQNNLYIALQTQLAVSDAKTSDLKVELQRVLEQNKILLQQNWTLDQDKIHLLSQLKHRSNVTSQ